ncbi:MAG: hypothetical protein RQ899_09090 [Pseudomonadales bacterium]|nr:hypothetical protein [Pseudomonadales bacterium]
MNAIKEDPGPVKLETLMQRHMEHLSPTGSQTLERETDADDCVW